MKKRYQKVPSIKAQELIALKNRFDAYLRPLKEELERMKHRNKNAK